MMELKRLNQTTGLEAPDTIFARDYNEALIHQIVVAYQANARQSNAKQKDRQEVAHTTRKPFNQKGTGRARAGMSSSPLWRGGGRIFPNTGDENYSQKVNKKMYRAGMCSILSQLAREGRLQVIEAITLDAPKTKLLAEKVKSLGLSNKILFVSDEIDENLYLASRNLMNVAAIEARYADPLSLIYFDHILVTPAGVEQLKEMFA